MANLIITPPTKIAGIPDPSLTLTLSFNGSPVNLTSISSPITDSVSGTVVGGNYNNAPEGLYSAVWVAQNGSATPATITRSLRIGLVATLGYVLDGDSITEGYGVTPSYPSQLATITGLPMTNLGVSGRTLAEMDSTFASRNVPTQYSSSGRNTLVILGGINDIMNTSGITETALRNSMTSYINKAKAAGYKVLVGTLLRVANFTTARETLRVGFNNWIRSNASNLEYTVVDFEAISEFSDPLNTVYFTDGLHLTRRGFNLLASAVRVASGVNLVVDTVPNAFTFTNITGASLSTDTSSSNVEITGINGPTPISVTGGSYSINGGTFVNTAGSVLPYDLVRMRVMSSSTANTETNGVLTIGGVASTFRVTTAPIVYVINDTFDSNTNGYTAYSPDTNNGWAVSVDAARLSLVLGRMRLTSSANRVYPYVVRTLSGLTVGRTYNVSVDQTALNRFGAMIGVFNTGGTSYSGERFRVNDVMTIGTITNTFVATQTTHYLVIMAGADQTGNYNEFDNIRVW